MEPQPAPDMYEQDGWGEHQTVHYVPVRFFELWTNEEKAWARGLYESDEFQSVLKRFLDIERELKGLERGARRTALAEERSALKA